MQIESRLVNAEKVTVETTCRAGLSQVKMDCTGIKPQAEFRHVIFPTIPSGRTGEEMTIAT